MTGQENAGKVQVPASRPPAVVLTLSYNLDVVTITRQEQFRVFTFVLFIECMFIMYVFPPHAKGGLTSM